MKIWRRKEKIAEIILLFMLICIIINYVADVFQRKESDRKYTPFFEQEKDYDVLFFGASHVMNGIFPMELWNDHGIVSYNFGSPSNQIPTSYWIMKNALDYTTPDLVVVDCMALGNNTKVCSNPDFVHISMDCFPVSRTKIKGVLDLMDDPVAEDIGKSEYYNKCLEYIWDFGKYHSRWEGLNENDWYNIDVSREKGAESSVAVAVPNEPAAGSSMKTIQENTWGKQYLEKIIQECKSRNIEVLLVYLPFPAPEGRYIEANTAQEIADENGINYINFLNMDVVDYDTDCYDPDSHLNPSGARKVSKYLGQYIKEHYSVPDRRNDPAYNCWYNDYLDYVAYKSEMINSQTEVNNVLMLLADKGFSTCIYIKSNSLFLQDQMKVDLLNNLCLYDKPVLEKSMIEEDTDYLIVVDNVKKEIWESRGQKCLEAETSFGKLSYDFTDGGMHNLHIIGRADNLLDYGMENEPDAQIIVIDNLSGEIVSHTKWLLEQTVGSIKIDQ